MENSGAQGTSGTPHPRPAMNGWRILGWGLLVALLLLPLVAMQFTDKVNWGPGDFLLMGAMLGGVGLTLEWVARRRSPVKVSRNTLLGTLIMLVGWMMIVAGLQCLLFLGLWGLGVAFTPLLSLAFAGTWLASAWQFMRAARVS